ncbi:hypothetical protein DTO207G8_920 [Paecilomyces variotii]|nr:hypothetical protein DTO169E5_4411 [Paecilomyces variotii]KAJ9259357.1 hypothetical protein DTO207G8_920 [Paecilomyces variotii]
MPHFEASPEDNTLEPIAVVGMSCRLPGGVNSPSSLWDLLVSKGSVQTPRVPESRFNIDAYLHSNLERPGSFNVAGGYFLDQPAENFDPSFFNMTPVEAMWLDPQQRKMLEVTYECFESAGLSLDEIAGSNTAVFVGSFTSDYQQMSIREPDFRHNYAATGVDPGLISNRIGNVFDLNGPSFTINTACSSSIYALHNACHALRSRDCSGALVGGVNLILTVDQHMNTAKLGILSPTSTCHTFDASADGYGRAEGAGALYLKRLSDAIRDGDPIRGVIRSSAVNTNGKVPGMGITHPSKKGQERVVRAAYERAGLDPSRTAYLECHGTGTPVGDPIESHAVSLAMNDTRSKESPLLIGAIKANIGHSEAASGIFAVMKAVMMTEAGVVPGVAGLKTLNPAINEEGWNIKVNRDSVPWPSEFLERRAGVSSFGYGGTNGHVIVESIESLYPHYQHGKPKNEAPYNHSAPRPFLVGLSAHDQATLTRNIAAHDAVASKFYLADLAYTLLERRTKLPHRAFTVASEESINADFDLSSFKFGQSPRSIPKVGFIFTGQGAQWAGMGVQAMKTFPSFMASIRRMDRVLQRLSQPPTWTIEATLMEPKETSRINEAEISQPVCTAVQIALVDLFAEWNIIPLATVGHSSGEIAAAYAAGRISAAQGIVAAFFRGYAVKHHAPVGAMLAVGLGRDEVCPYLGDSEVVIACENSPASVTLSGPIEAIHSVKARLDQNEVFCRELKTGKAYHSPQMSAVSKAYDALLDEWVRAQAAHLVDRRRPRASWVSSVTGKEVIDDTIPTTYWSKNLRCRVLFDAAVSGVGNLEVLQGEDVVMIEIGPHSALAGPFKQICKANSNLAAYTYIPSLIRGEDSAVRALHTAGNLWMLNYNIAIDKVNQVLLPPGPNGISKVQRPFVLPDLPSYNWNYDRIFWAEPRTSREIRSMHEPRHDLLGREVAGLSHQSRIWRNILRTRDVPWLSDHRLGNVNVFPAAGYLSLAYEAIRQIFHEREPSLGSITFRNVALQVALAIPDTDDGVEILVQLTELQKPSTIKASPWYSFAVRSISQEGQWTVHCEGKVSINCRDEDTAEQHQHPVDTPKLTRRVTGKTWYDAFKRVGFEYGPSFQPLNQIRTDIKYHHASAQAEIVPNSGLMTGESPYLLHPSTIDGCLQLIIISINRGLHKEMPHGVVPINIDELTIWAPGDEVGSVGDAVAWTTDLSGRYFISHSQLMTPAGRKVLDVKGLRSVAYEAAVPPKADVDRGREPYMQTVWKPDITTFDDSHAISNLISAEVTSEVSIVSRLSELINHKRPVRSVLFAGRPDGDIIHAVLGHVSHAQNVTIVDSEKDYLDSLQEDSSFSFPSTCSFVIAKGHFPNKSMPETWDLVIFGQAGKIAEQRVFLTKCHHIIWSANSEEGLNLTKELSQLDFSVSRTAHTQDTCLLYCSSNLDSQGNLPPSPESLVIFHRDDETQKLAANELLPNYRAVVETKALSKAATAENANFDRLIIYDTDGLLLSSLSEDTFDALKIILASAKSILWLTSGANEGRSAAAAMSQGFLRTLRSEQANAQILLLDTDQKVSPSDLQQAILKCLSRISTKDSEWDTELWLHKGVLHIPRIFPNDTLNVSFTEAGRELEETILSDDRSLAGRFDIGDAIVFESREAVELDDGELELRVDAVELAKNSLRVGHTGSQIVVGTIKRVGGGLDKDLLGQQAVAYSSTLFATPIRAKLQEVAVFSGLAGDMLAATLPSLIPATHLLLRTAKAQAQDRVLLLPSPMPFVKAVARLRSIIGFRLDILVSTDQDYAQVLAEISPSPDVQVSLSSTLHRIDSPLDLHKESQPTVIIAQDFSPLSQEAWRSIPALGRFVLASTAVDASPDTLPFTRGASFQSTTVEALLKHDRKSLLELLQYTIKLLQQNPDLSALPGPTVIDVADLRDLSSIQQILDSTESTVLRYRYGHSIVPVRDSSGGLRFQSDVAYLLVGCLGGLGRSLTRWMMDRGARHFVFISRSGADKPEAAMLVDSIRQAGAAVDVYRADVSKEQDVAGVIRTVTASWPIRGVVHAAMVLEDALFDRMDFSQFQASVVPKKDGARNLHKALETAGTDLDFFVMTSSISATMGNPGQANYCAGNSYLDGLAWQRYTSGIPATSLILPMILDVGIVSENVGIEVALSRKAMYGIDEMEMLRGFETAMSIPHSSDSHLFTAEIMGNAQVILGLEPTYLAAAIQSAGTGEDAYWFHDARFLHLRSSVETIIKSTSGGSGNSDSDIGSELKAAQAKGAGEVLIVISRTVIDKLSRMLLVPAENFEFEGSSVSSYGIDSMIGTELRNWLFKQFGLEISFQRLLDSTMNVKALATAIAQGMGLLEL